MSRNTTSASGGGPSFKKKFVDLFRQISQPGGRGSRDDAPPPRPDTFIHKYLQGEGRRPQPEIQSGRSCDALPPLTVFPLHPRVYAAFTGPGGGLASINTSTHAIDIPDTDVGFIDENDEDLPDDQPNAYVTCQRPPPRKSAFSDMAEYFRRPGGTGCGGGGKLPASATACVNNTNLINNNSNHINNNDVNAVGVLEEAQYASKDSLEGGAPSWRGEAPSPLSPHPARAPSNAFLHFGDSPLNYELSVPPPCHPPGAPTSASATRSCENICSAASPVSNVSSPCGGSLGSLEGAADEDGEILVSCHDDNGTVNSLVLSNGLITPSSPTTELDMNFNPLVKPDKGVPCCSSLHAVRSTPITPQRNSGGLPLGGLPDAQSVPSTPRGDFTNGDGGDHKVPQVSLQQKILLQSLANKTALTRPAQSHLNNNVESKGDCFAAEGHTEDLTNEGGLIDHRAKFLTLELVEGCTLSAPHPALKRSEQQEVAGVLNWNRPSDRAFGLSTTLYERHPITRERAGNPIADSFGVVARYDSALLALADGVNWGDKACLAARCAVHGCLAHLNAALFAPGLPRPPRNTTDLFVALLRSFHAAHNLILEQRAQLTTLTAAVIAPLSGSTRYVACVCNVGDSLAYVYSTQHGVREITQGSHDITSARDMRDALGALGPVDGQNPELNNLTCSMTIVEEGDIVFLTSDGISDNFDPVVGKFVLPRPDENTEGGTGGRKKTESEKIQEEERLRQLQRQATAAAAQNENGNKGKKHMTKQQQLLQKYQQLHQQQMQQQQYRLQKQQSRTQRMRQQQAGSTRTGFKQVVSRSKSQPAVNITTSLTTAPEGRRPATLAGHHHSTGPYSQDLLPPVVEAHQRHELTLLRMEDLLRCGITTNKPVTTAQTLCLEMVHFATKLTLAKRRVLEDPDLYPPPKAAAAGLDGDGALPSNTQLSRNEQRNRRRKVQEKLALVPGKLDHATVVAYCVGPYESERPLSPIHVLPLHSSHLSAPHHTRTLPSDIANHFTAPLASPDSIRSVAVPVEECRLVGTMPPLPESSPPRGRVTLARGESVDIGDAVDDAQTMNGVSKGEDADVTTTELPKEVNDNSAYEIKKRGTNGGRVVDQSVKLRDKRNTGKHHSKTGSSSGKFRKETHSDGFLNASRCTERHPKHTSVGSCVETTKMHVQTGSLGDTRPSDVERLSIMDANASSLDKRVSSLKIEFSNKENLSPNFPAFELPLKPVVETLL